MEVICYVCNCPTNDWRRNLVQTKSQHSKTPISNFLKQFLGINFSRRDIDNESNCICSKCINLIDVYDWMCVTTSEKEKELTDLFLATEATFVIPKVESEEAEFDIYDTQSNNSVYAEPFSTDYPDGFNDAGSEFDAGEDQMENLNWNTKTKIGCLIVNCFTNFTQINGKIWMGKCNFCSKMIRYRYNANSNLKTHLKRRHPEILKSFEAESELQSTGEMKETNFHGPDGTLKDSSTLDIDANADTKNGAHLYAQCDSPTPKASQSEKKSDSDSNINNEIENAKLKKKSRLSCSVLSFFSNSTHIEGKILEANCNFCYKAIRYQDKVSSNLRTHMNRCHPEILKPFEAESELQSLKEIEGTSFRDAEVELKHSSTCDIEENADTSNNALLKDQSDSLTSKASQSSTIFHNKRQRESDSDSNIYDEIERETWRKKSLLNCSVLNYFSNFTQIEGKTWVAKCVFCSKMIRYQENVKSNLKTHLNRCRIDIWERLEAESKRRKKQNMEKGLLDAEATLDSLTSYVDVNADAETNIFAIQAPNQAPSESNGNQDDGYWNTRSEVTRLIVKCFKNFTRIEGKNWGANCNLCQSNKILKYHEGVSSNLKHHLKRCHPKVWNQIEQACEK